MKNGAWEKVLGAFFASDSRFKDATKPLEREFWEILAAAAKPPPKDRLDAEREGMQQLADSRLRWFQGRGKELKQFTDFILAPADEKTSRLAVLAAVPGQGKSALMAKLDEALRHSSFLPHHPLRRSH